MTRLPPLRIPRCLLDPCADLPAADGEGLVTVVLEHREGRITAIRPARACGDTGSGFDAEPGAGASGAETAPWLRDPAEALTAGMGLAAGRGEGAARHGQSGTADGLASGLAGGLGRCGSGPARPPLALTPLVDAHVHLDKAWTAEAFPNPAGTMAGALAANLREIAQRTPEAVHARGERALERAWRQGCRALRSHADSLGPAAEGGWEALIDLRQRWAGRIELQLVALAPLDHWGTPEGEALARRVAADGGLLGGVVGPPFARHSFDRNRLSGLLRLAERLGCGIDLHIDEGDRQPARGLRLLVTLLERQPCGVPITCSHASSMVLLPDRALTRLAERLAALRIAVVALPLTNLWLLGKRQGHTPWRRPQTPLHQLQAAGVTVALASDNVCDPWYPGGDFDPVELLRLSPLFSHLQPWRRSGLAPFSSGASRILDLAWDGVLREGSPADLLVLGCDGWGELLARTPRRRVLRAGRWLPPPAAETATRRSDGWAGLWAPHGGGDGEPWSGP